MINYLLLTLKCITAYTVSGWFLKPKQVTIKIKVFWHATPCQWATCPAVLKDHSAFILIINLLERHDHKMNALQTLKMPELPAHPHSFTPQNI
jgi:hypothetical protein